MISAGLNDIVSIGIESSGGVRSQWFVAMMQSVGGGQHGKRLCQKMFFLVYKIKSA